jgi:rhamnosyl/mannosyltransferase
LDNHLRVLQVYRTYFPDPPGGLQEAIRQIALATAQLGIENRIFTLSTDPDPARIHRAEGWVVREKSWAAPASCDLGGAAAFRTFQRESASADVIHYQFPWPFLDVLHAVSRPRAPAVVTYHADVVRQKLLGAAYAPLMWRTLRSMRFIVATSPAYARTSPVLAHPAIRDKVRVIPLGIDEASLSQASDDAIFNRIGLRKDEPYFLFVGVLRYYKGLHTLIRTAAQIAAPIVIAGSGPEGMALKALAEQLGATNVIFAGQVSDSEKRALMQACCAFVLPSHLRSEAFGMVLIEAAIFAKPLLSCEIGTGTSYVNAHEETGFVVPPESPHLLAHAMQQLLNDSALAKEMGQAARKRYELLFSAEALGKAYQSLYREAACGDD